VLLLLLLLLLLRCCVAAAAGALLLLLLLLLRGHGVEVIACRQAAGLNELLQEAGGFSGPKVNCGVTRKKAAVAQAATAKRGHGWPGTLSTP
jgi:hypothetical protein